MRLRCCMCVYVSRCARQRLVKNPPIVDRQRFGLVKIPLSLLGNGSIKTLPQ
jgi:hypothetical protein